MAEDFPRRPCGCPEIQRKTSRDEAESAAITQA
jgi:hypothetical protein